MVGVTQRSRADRALRLVTDWCNGGSLQELLNDAFGGDEMEVRSRRKQTPTCCWLKKRFQRHQWRPHGESGLNVYAGAFINQNERSSRDP